MGKNSGIQWTDDTDNIIFVAGGGWWCQMISEGCANCYAARLNQNAFYGGNGLPYTGEPPQLVLRHDILAGWARQTRPRLHFVSSMTDVFGHWVSTEMIMAMLDAMAAAPNQIFQVLTKRPENFSVAAKLWCATRGTERLPANIWAGVSVENQKRADERREEFKLIRAWRKFVSYEPALGPVDWTGWEFVDQIISGGESGPKARPSHPDWHRATRDWCAKNAKAYFFKQWGEWLPISQMSRGVADLWHDYARHGKPPRRDEFDQRPAPRDAASTVVQLDGSQRWEFPHGAMTCFQVGKITAGRALDGSEHNAFPAIDHPALEGRNNGDVERGGLKTP